MEDVRPHYRTAGSGSIWNFLLGIWLVISPFVLAFAQLERARWNNIACGGAIALLALGAMSERRSQAGGNWFSVLLGIWLIISPFVLGFSARPTPLWNNIILGVVVALSAWAGTTTVPSDLPQPPGS